MWGGNTSVDATSDKPVIFDASSMYAHNECKKVSHSNLGYATSVQVSWGRGIYIGIRSIAPTFESTRSTSQYQPRKKMSKTA